MGIKYGIKEKLVTNYVTRGTLNRKKLKKKSFKLDLPLGGQNFAPPIEISIFDNFQNYRRKFIRFEILYLKKLKLDIFW